MSASPEETGVEVDAALLDAIGHLGLSLDELRLSVERNVNELLQETRQWETRQQIAFEQWGGVTQQLAELLRAKTQETVGVSASYRTLAEHLAQFAAYLVKSETTMSLVDERLRRSSSVDDTSAWLTETQARHEQLTGHLSQLTAYLQTLSHRRPAPKSEAWIWTEVLAWRPAMIWCSIGGAAAASFIWVSFRVSGFELAARALVALEARLDRIEQFLGGEVSYEEPTFDARPRPTE